MRRVVSLLTLVFGFFILWIIYLADTGQNSLFFQLVRAIPYGDKLGHFFLFGLFAFGMNMTFSFKGVRFRRMRIYYGATLVGIVVLGEEISQHFVTNRTFDATDLLADFAGILVFSIICSKLSGRWTGAV